MQAEVNIRAKLKLDQVKKQKERAANATKK